MEIAYRFNNKEIEKLKKYKNPSILLKKNNILKNGKYKLHLTIGMFNKLLNKGELKYTFTDKRKNIIYNKEVVYLIFLKLFYHMLKILQKKSFLL